jgi:hypothetical protein
MTVDIRPNTFAYGNFQLVEPPILTYNMPPLKDAFTRDYPDFAVMNFGTDPIMITGKGDYAGTQENYSSFIHFDIANFGARKIIKTAKLRLYYFDSQFDAGSIVELHEIAIPFSEQGITYYNQPAILNKLFDRYTLNEVDKYIEFDITDFAKAVYNGTQVFNGFAIVTSENKQYKFYTKESSKSPQLTLTYIDQNINASSGYFDMTADVTIQGVGRSDRDFNMTVKSMNGINTVDATMYVHKYVDPVPDDRDFDVTINNPHVNATATVSILTSSDMDMTTTVRNSKVSDRDFDVTISNPSISPDVFVKYRDTIDTDVTIRANANDDVDLDVTVSNPEVNATMNIYFHDVGDIDGQVFIRVQQNDDLTADVTVRNNVESVIDGTVIISNPTINTDVSIMVSDNSYRDFTMTTRGIYFDDRDFDVTISNPEINLTAEVVESKYIDLDMYVRQTVNDNVDSDVIINNPDINLDMTTRAYKEESIDTEVYIRVEDHNDIDVDVAISNPTIDASVMIPYHGTSDIDMSMTPRVRAVSDLSASVIIGSMNNGAYGFIL